MSSKNIAIRASYLKQAIQTRRTSRSRITRFRDAKSQFSKGTHAIVKT